MWLLLVFFSLSSLGEDFASEKYCFNSPQVALKARAKFAGIQVPSDSVNTDDSCLLVTMKPHRRELIQRFFRSEYPDLSIPFSSAEIKRDPCHLQVEKEKLINGETTEVGANENQILLNRTNTNGNANETMEIQTLKEFLLTVDQDEIKGECRTITPQRYEISITVSKNPKPLVQANLPPGTVVVINTPPPPQETATLSTQIQLMKGERIELGSVVKNLRDKNHQVDLDPSIEATKVQRSATEKVWLSLQ